MEKIIWMKTGSGSTVRDMQDERLRRTLGFLHSISFDTMQDARSGRGVFLIPFMKEFPWMAVTSLDLLDKRVNFLNELIEGGFRQLHARKKDICDQPYRKR